MPQTVLEIKSLHLVLIDVRRSHPGSDSFPTYRGVCT